MVINSNKQLKELGLSRVKGKQFRYKSVIEQNQRSKLLV